MKSRLLYAVSAVLFTFVTVSANAAFNGRLPATPGDTDYQAYYDDQLDITWTTNADINGSAPWDNQVAWAAGLTINGFGGWRLPNMDVNGDGGIVDCELSTQVACKDNEYGHLWFYGAGSELGNGVTFADPDPFSNVQVLLYWSGTESATDPGGAWGFLQSYAINVEEGKSTHGSAWAVADGDAFVPIPPAIWLFGSGLLGLIGIARKEAA